MHQMLHFCPEQGIQGLLPLLRMPLMMPASAANDASAANSAGSSAAADAQSRAASRTLQTQQSTLIGQATPTVQLVQTHP
ncbi:hypothetical protein ACYATO_00095 [Lactobacillaceae bacterium Melli_B3]